VTSGVELVKLHVWRPLVVNYKTACVAASGLLHCVSIISVCSQTLLLRLARASQTSII